MRKAYEVYEAYENGEFGEMLTVYASDPVHAVIRYMEKTGKDIETAVVREKKTDRVFTIWWDNGWDIWEI